MSKKTGLGQLFLIDGYDLSGDVGAVNEARSPRPSMDVTGISSSARERILLASDGLLGFASWFNDAANSSHAALSSRPTTDRVVLWAMGSSIGDSAAGLTAKQLDYDATVGDDGSLALTTRCEADGSALEWLDMLTAGIDTHASASSSASKDDTSQTTSGVTAYLQVTDIASGTPTLKIEDSPNDSAWSTLVTFSAVADGAEPTAERVAASGTVDRYLRVTSTGTFSNFDFAVGYRRGESVDD